MSPRFEEELASRVVDLALSEDPGYQLGAGFAERVTQRVFGREMGFAWFENVAVPMLFVASLLLAFPFAAQQLRPALASVLPATAHALAPWETVRWDLLGSAAGVLLLVALAEKLAATRWRHLLPS